MSRGCTPVRMHLAHARKPNAVEGLEPTGGIRSYFIGTIRISGGRTFRTTGASSTSPCYAGVEYGDPPKLEYDLVVEPGADVSAIQLEYGGVEPLRLHDASVLLVLHKNEFFAVEVVAVLPAERITSFGPTLLHQQVV
jgi:hypothetical protein